MRAVIYARYSSDSQREESIDGQLRECREYAAYNDLEIVGVYIDRALSAKTDNRPEFQKMIKDSYKTAFDVIIVWKLDRFAATAMIRPLQGGFEKERGACSFGHREDLLKPGRNTAGIPLGGLCRILLCRTGCEGQAGAGRKRAERQVERWYCSFWIYGKWGTKAGSRADFSRSRPADFSNGI